MSAIRVSCLPDRTTEKEIKMHFANPEHGGGPIEKIYFPMLDDDAVVVFEDPHTAKTCKSYDHVMGKKSVFVKQLPQVQIFTSLEAELDPTVTAFLQATEEARDRIQYESDIAYHHDDNSNMASICGNWYQLEWVWKYLDDIMDHQQLLQDKIATKSFSRYMSDSDTESEGEIRGDNPIISIPVEKELPVTNKTQQVTGLPPQKQKSKGRPKPSPLEAVSRELKEQGKALDEGDAHIPQKDDRDDKRNRSSLTESGDQLADAKDIEEIMDAETSADTSPFTELASPFINDNPNDVMSLEFKHGDVHVKIYNGDITLVETDVVVNAAMGSLINGGGVALAITKAASPNMQKECDAYVKQHGNLRVSDVIHTCAGGRMSDKVKHIVHTVGPMWSTYLDKALCRHQLTKTFLYSMTYTAQVLKLKSLAFPVISSGIFGVPLEICLRAFLDAVLLYTAEKAAVRLKEVHLVQRWEEDTAVTVVILRQLIEGGLDELMAEAVADFEKFIVQEQKERQENKSPQKEKHSSTFMSLFSSKSNKKK